MTQVALGLVAGRTAVKVFHGILTDHDRQERTEAVLSPVSSLPVRGSSGVGCRNLELKCGVDGRRCCLPVGD
jgi:hypothetical protein